jgi:transcriptional regulator with XRE-family HTH domain
MQIDSMRIRAEREQRAWSQEHLAEAAGLALRTVQRVENGGAASYETARALAAVLGIEVAALRPPLIAQRRATNRRAWYLGAAASTALAVALGFFARDAIAAQVMLDVGVSIGGAEASQSQLTTSEGEGAEIRLEGQLRVILQPSINADGSVALAIQILEFTGEDFVLAATPKIFVADNDRAEIQVTSPLGRVIRLAIRPHKV